MTAPRTTRCGALSHLCGSRRPEAGAGETDADWLVEHTGTHHRDILDEVLGAVPFAVVVTSEPPPKPTFRQLMQEATANAGPARPNAASEANQARRTALAEAQFNGLKLSSKARTLPELRVFLSRCASRDTILD